MFYGRKGSSITHLPFEWQCGVHYQFTAENRPSTELPALRLPLVLVLASRPLRTSPCCTAALITASRRTS